MRSQCLISKSCVLIMGLLAAVMSHSIVMDNESFELGLGIWLNNSSQSTHSWSIISGNTPSGGTGPSGASHGSRYLYLETSRGDANASGDNAILESGYVFDGVKEIAFDYHMYGADTGSLSVDIYSNDIGGWIKDIWQVSGQQHASTLATYSRAIVDLSDHQVQAVRIRATAAGNYRGDIAIDNLVLSPLTIEPVAPIFLETPIKLHGTMTAAFSESINDKVKDDNGDLIEFKKLSGPDWLKMSLSGELTGTPMVENQGINKFEIQITDGDFVTLGDLQVDVDDKLKPVLLFSENFESTFQVWNNIIGDDNKDWTLRHQGQTPSAQTGPIGSSLGSYYTYLETSGSGANNTGDFAILESPVFSASGVMLKFDYHMYGSAIGSLAVELRQNGGWETVWIKSNQQHASSLASYLTEEIDLAGYDVERIRFKATALGGFRGDIALDNIEIYETQYVVLDEDGDGVIDSEDAFPNNPLESNDNDFDGLGDNADTDDDNDGALDVNDLFPFDASEFADTDNDGVGNNADTDDDNDGVLDAVDDFPFDNTESVDTDLDGVGNNADIDDDNDTVLDVSDAFPLDVTESVDTDNDGVGNNADIDDDNDGLSDADEINIYNSNPFSADTDSDGMPDAWEVGYGLQPSVNDAALDNDSDGISNLDEFILGGNPMVATDSLILLPIVSGNGIDGGSSQNWQLDGVFESEGVNTQWIVEKWRSLDFTKKYERRFSSEYELANVLLDEATTVMSAILTITLNGKWGDAGLLSYLQTYAYIGNSNFDLSDLSERSLKVAETSPNSISSGSVFSIDITGYINSLSESDSPVVGLVHSMYGFTDRIDFEKNIKLKVQFERTQ